ncbi:MAG: hypothetical protein GF390_00205, partial [Candidatus Pacebacteria bacterium]|nr:hypothetical protein [Candidatus Paceibacterota bacterium]
MKLKRKLYFLGSLLVVFWVGLLTNQHFVKAVQAATIEVSDPGDHQDIRPVIQNAVDSASDGDVIVLPAGEFVLTQRVSITGKFVSIRGQGSDTGGTKLYRPNTVSDNDLEGDQWRYMFKFSCNSTQPSNIIVADIYFQGKNPGSDPQNPNSSAEDYGLGFVDCVDFVVAKNKLEYFGRAGILVDHQPNLASGLIFDNQFIHNVKWDPTITQNRKVTLGYGILLYSSSATSWANSPGFGTDNFIFIEDNYFFEHRHAVTGDSASRYVFRNNEVRDNFWGQAVDAHGGGLYGNAFSARAYEVYNNQLINDWTVIDEAPDLPSQPIDDFLAAGGQPCRAAPNERYVHRAIALRGGEGLVYSNYIEGYKVGTVITIESNPSSPDPNNYPYVNTSGLDTYQIGYLSGLNYGVDHSGAAMPYGDGDLFAWNNSFYRVCLREFQNDYPTTLLIENRDYHRGIAKPGYTAYTYPHPLRSLYNPPASPTPTPTDVPDPSNTPTPTPTDDPNDCSPNYSVADFDHDCDVDEIDYQFMKVRFLTTDSAADINGPAGTPDGLVD